MIQGVAAKWSFSSLSAKNSSRGMLIKPPICDKKQMGGFFVFVVLA